MAGNSATLDLLTLLKQGSGSTTAGSSPQRPSAVSGLTLSSPPRNQESVLSLLSVLNTSAEQPIPAPTATRDGQTQRQDNAELGPPARPTSMSHAGSGEVAQSQLLSQTHFDPGTNLLAMLNASTKPPSTKPPSTESPPVAQAPPLSRTSSSHSQAAQSMIGQPSVEPTGQASNHGDPPRKQSPFTFVSPFDALEQIHAKSRAVTSPPLLSAVRASASRSGLKSPQNVNKQPTHVSSRPSSAASSSVAPTLRAAALAPLPRSPDVHSSSSVAAGPETPASRQQDPVSLQEGLHRQSSPAADTGNELLSLLTGAFDRSAPETASQLAVPSNESTTVESRDVKAPSPQYESMAMAEEPTVVVGVDRTLDSVLPQSGVSEQRQNGFALLPESSVTRTQVFTISLTAENEDLQTSLPSQQVPIARLTTPVRFPEGRQVAVNGLLSYATRAGRIRVVDPKNGARLIFKAHSRLVNDMEISAGFSDAHDSGGRMRRLVSVTTGKLVVTQVPENFENDDERASTGLELNGPVVNFKKVTFSPADPAMLACVHNDGTFYLINLDETRGVMSEAESRRAIFASPSHPIGQRIAAAAFSGDGTVLAVVSDEGALSLFSTVDMSVIDTSLLPGTTSGQEISSLLILDHISRHGRSLPCAIAVNRGQGRAIEIFSLQDLSQPSCIIRIEPSGGEQAAETPNIGVLDQIPDTGFLSLSSSRRQSFFLLGLDLGLPESTQHANLESETGADVVSRLLVRKVTASHRPAPRLVKVVEVPVGQPVIQYACGRVLDQQCIMYLHSDGFEQLSLDRSILALHDDSDEPIDLEENPEKPDMDEQSTQHRPSAASDGARSVGEYTMPTEVAKREPLGEEDLRTGFVPQRFDTGRHTHTSHSSDDAVEEALQAISNARESDASPAPHVQPARYLSEQRASAAAQALMANQSVEDVSAALGEPIKARMQQSSNAIDSAAIASQMQNLFVEQARLFESMLVTQQLAERARYDQMLASVSNLLNQDLALAKQAISQNAVPSTDFVKAVTEQVLPEIVKAFGDLTTAVDRAAQDQVAVVKQTALQSIRASIIEGLAAHLPTQFEKLTEALPKLIVPAVEASMHRLLQPQLDSLGVLISEQTATLNNVRALMIHEQTQRDQSSAKLEAELIATRSLLTSSVERARRESLQAVAALRDELARASPIHSVAVGNGVYQAASHPGGLSPPTAPSGASGLATSLPTVEVQRSQSDPERPISPAEAYEDMFLRALSHSKNALGVLVDDAPPHRLERIFPPGEYQPKLSGANILAVCVMASKALAEGGSGLDAVDKKRLAWIAASLRASPSVRRDPRYGQYLPRIMAEIVQSLRSRMQRLVDDKDAAQLAAAVRVVEQVATGLDT